MKAFNCFVKCVLTLFTHASLMVSGYDQFGRSTESPDPPSFRDTPSTVTVHEGGLAVLECTINNLGTKNVIWRRKSEPSPLTIDRRTFVNDDRFSVQNTPLQPEWPLFIKQVRIEDEGHYECQVSSKDRALRHYVYLKVKRGHIVSQESDMTEETNTKISKNTVLEKGQLLRLSCNVTSAPGVAVPDEIDWFHNGETISSSADKRSTIRKRVSLNDRSIHSTLDINPVTMNDSGVYICRTSSGHLKRVQVDVLNADTKNSKRNIHHGTKSSKEDIQVYEGNSRGQSQFFDDSDGSESNDGLNNHAGRAFESSMPPVVLAALTCLLNALLSHACARTPVFGTLT